MKTVFSTKAGTLRQLAGRLGSARVAPLVVITVKDWRVAPEDCLRKIIHELDDLPLIVRSSCRHEDGMSTSNAGAFLSVANVSANELASVIGQVIGSYGVASPDDEVLIQPMLTKVLRSGVAFSHDPGTCAPYRMVNWVDGEDTAAVTGGRAGRTWQQAALSSVPAPKHISPVITLVEELLHLFDNFPLDCEFAVTEEDSEEVLWLLQARPLVLRKSPESEESQRARLQIVQKKVEQGLRPHPFLMGHRTVYGVMPDWNPAEILGIRPNPLALSLYRDLVTDSIWAYQRHNYGYRNLRSFPLMPNFFGLPYIDVRLSFNSFIPADLEEGLAGRLVDHYIERLLEQPTLHDKVEFEIVFSCYTLDLPERMKRLAGAGFSAAERDQIAESLRCLTNRIVHPETGLWRKDAKKLDVLLERHAELKRSTLDPIERIYWLLEDAKRYGTLPFAGLARAGFVAVQMLRSLVSVGIFSQNDYDAFIGSVSTVSGQLARDRALLGSDDFLKKYGHLRPGTYDIGSPRYDESPDRYFDWNAALEQPKGPTPFSVTLPQMREVARLLKAHDLDPDPVGLFDFMQAGIELRELAKFHFTRNLSDAMSMMVETGAEYGFSKEEMAYCSLDAFRELHIAALDIRDTLARSIELGRARHSEALALSLPPVISRPEDVWGFEWPESSPNFITQKKTVGRVVGPQCRDDLAGAVVCIPNADPGYDWLFAYPIAGLITAWGGANSHMAIRAGELGLPSVIGAGEALFNRWAGAGRLHVDCANKRVEVLA